PAFWPSSGGAFSQFPRWPIASLRTSSATALPAPRASSKAISQRRIAGNCIADLLLWQRDRSNRLYGDGNRRRPAPRRGQKKGRTVRAAEGREQRSLCGLPALQRSCPGGENCTAEKNQRARLGRGPQRDGVFGREIILLVRAGQGEQRPSLRRSRAGVDCVEVALRQARGRRAGGKRTGGEIHVVVEPDLPDRELECGRAVRITKAAEVGRAAGVVRAGGFVGV